MEMFKSATRVTLLTMVLALVGINIFALINYPETIFNTTFLVFKDIVLMIATYFFAKSTQDTGKPVVEKKDEFVV
jgi:hypothetical protein